MQCACLNNLTSGCLICSLRRNKKLTKWFQQWDILIGQEVYANLGSN